MGYLSPIQHTTCVRDPPRRGCHDRERVEGGEVWRKERCGGRGQDGRKLRKEEGSLGMGK